MSAGLSALRILTAGEGDRDAFMMSDGKVNSEAIFIFGMMSRTGTTFLQRLLCLHPDCERFSLPEDFLFMFSDPLIQYADRMKAEYRSWAPNWGLRAETSAELEALLDRSAGDAILRFISGLSGDRRPVLKTPAVQGVRNFLRLCPDRRCVLLVRDGRSVAESLLQSGLPRQREKTLDWCAENWAWAAEEVGRLKEAPGFERVLIVRFEDLVQRTSDELERILKFLELATDRYPMDQALSLPVSGSSFVGDSRRRWVEVAKPADFRPEIRFGHWDREQHVLFNSIAGAGLAKLGYVLK